MTKDATDASGSVNALVSENQVLTKQMAGLLRDRELMRMDIDAAEAQINQLKEAISMKEDSRNKVLTSYNQLAANNDKLQAELNELSSRNGKLHQDVVNYQKALTEAESALSAKDQQLRTQAAEADTLRRDRVEQLAYLENCKSQLQQTRLELANAVSERNQAVEQLAGKIKDLEVDKLAFENQVAAESARADRFESLATLERTRKENAERTVKDLDLSVSNLTRKMQTLTTQHNEVLASLDKEILALRSERNAVSAKNETLQSQLASLQINLADYEDQVKHKDRIIDELLMNPGVSCASCPVRCSPLLTHLIFCRTSSEAKLIARSLPSSFRPRTNSDRIRAKFPKFRRPALQLGLSGTSDAATRSLARQKRRCKICDQPTSQLPCRGQQRKASRAPLRTALKGDTFWSRSKLGFNRTCADCRRTVANVPSFFVDMFFLLCSTNFNLIMLYRLTIISPTPPQAVVGN